MYSVVWASRIYTDLFITSPYGGAPSTIPLSVCCPRIVSIPLFALSWGPEEVLFERLKVNHLTYYLFTFYINCKLYDMWYAFAHCVLSFVSSRVLCFPFSGDDAVIDRYDYMRSGLEYEEYDDEW